MASVQCAKKVVSNSPGLVDFGTGLVNSVLNLPEGHLNFFLGIHCNQSCSSKTFFGLYKVTLGLVHSSYSLPEWQAVKLTFFTHTLGFQHHEKTMTLKKFWGMNEFSRNQKIVTDGFP